MKRARDWRVVVDDTGGPQAGWPSVWSDEEDRSVLHQDGFIQEYWDGPSRHEAMMIAQVVADFMNGKILKGRDVLGPLSVPYRLYGVVVTPEGEAL